jgi:hypothetical protein
MLEKNQYKIILKEVAQLKADITGNSIMQEFKKIRHLDLAYPLYTLATMPHYIFEERYFSLFHYYSDFTNYLLDFVNYAKDPKKYIIYWKEIINDSLITYREHLNENYIA